MLMTSWERRLLNRLNYSSHASSVSADMGPLFTCCVTAVLQGVSLPAGWWRLQRGSAVTDDLEIVRLSDRVMARRHSLTDQARREEIRGEEGWGREGKPGSLCLPIWGDMGGGDGRKTNLDVLEWWLCCLDDQEALISVDDVFKRFKDWKCAPLGSIKLVSIQCRSMISKIVCSQAESSHPEQT